MLYCLVINVHPGWNASRSNKCAYQLSASATRLYYHVLRTLSTTFFNFFDFVFALSTKALKTHHFLVDLLLPRSATLDTIHPPSTKVNNIFKTFFEPAKQTKSTTSFVEIVDFAQMLFA